LESNVALLQAASGLEKTMVGGSKDSILRDSTVAQVSAALYYQANVVAKLSESQQFKNAFKKIISEQIVKDFGDYIDAKARMNPKSLHHVYEWKKIGIKAARLFKLVTMDTPGISFKITYEFKPSKSFVPNKVSNRRHVFVNKASIMESGKSLTIRPRHAQRLVFESDGALVFLPKGRSVFVKSPGGKAAKNQFSLAYARFFNSNLVSESIKKSGFQRIFNSASAKALKIPSSIKKVKYSFAANTVRSEADAAVAAAWGGVLV
jgi:hypothetical protein